MDRRQRPEVEGGRLCRASESTISKGEHHKEGCRRRRGISSRNTAVHDSTKEMEDRVARFKFDYVVLLM